MTDLYIPFIERLIQWINHKSGKTSGYVHKQKRLSIVRLIFFGRFSTVTEILLHSVVSNIAVSPLNLMGYYLSEHLSLMSSTQSQIVLVKAPLGGHLEGGLQVFYKRQGLLGGGSNLIEPASGGILPTSPPC